MSNMAFSGFWTKLVTFYIQIVKSDILLFSLAVQFLIKCHNYKITERELLQSLHPQKLRERLYPRSKQS